MQIETGKSKYELGVYENSALIKIFRTDCELILEVVEIEARRCASVLKKSSPENIYEVKRINGETIAKYGWGQR